MVGIFWDCDGTIMDTERLYAYAWQSHLKQYGLDISEDEIRQFVGVDDRIVHSFYSDSVDIENFETTMLSLGNIIQESLNDKLLYNDSKILLNQINKLDIKQACVSASPHELLNKKLQEVQIDKLFEYIIGGDMVKRNKPYPDIYNKAIENLQTTKNIIIEDSPTGIQSGKNTNSFVLAVNRGIFSPDQLDQADLIVDELNLEIINKILETL
ncbi:HAD family phosphatase [Candidatus Actinomarina]|nr:HAD family phosphatase [Candidatus Actinomarina sp.]|tara:strand:+ start:46 stop:681 length:636 start_codon:yes stop_codon:yes gene_type:complete